jgi:hypothetical protein
MTLFDWLKELTGKKRDWDSFSDKEKESFNPYMVNRFLSMHQPFIELINYVQTIPYTNKEKYYRVYCNLLPKQNVWLKYIKPKMKQPNKKLLETIASLYEVSTKQAASWVNILDKKYIKEALQKQGLQDNEIKELFK